MSACEANFDGLVGPTHNYAGLSVGNIASASHRDQPSSPRDAALQGLAKMRRLMALGLVQGVLAPQERPDMATLRQLGFHGSDAQVLSRAAREAPRLLAACCSASSMWAANAATVSPSADCADGRVHFTPANLVSKLHRSLEPDTTARILRATFADERQFAHHRPLPASEVLGDEGAANHNRLCRDHAEPGVELFVYGRVATDTRAPAPRRFPARQTREACEALIRKHRLDPARVLLVQQNPAVIDQGVFHNDVIAVANRNLLFCHEAAFLEQRALADTLQQRLDGAFRMIEVPSEQVSVDAAVNSYLFNSQLLTLPNGSTLLLVPGECEREPSVWHYLQSLLSDANGIDQLEVADLRQSMANGGGPACLRLRVVLTPAQQRAVNQHTLLTPQLASQLDAWIRRHYRDRLCQADLADPQLLEESRTALDELTGLLALGSIYPFQR